MGLALSWPVDLEAASAVPSATDLFEEHQVLTGTAPHQTILTGFVLGGDLADLVVVSAGDADGPRVEIYAFDGSEWTSRVRADLPAETLAVDIAGIGGRDRLLSYERTGFRWLDSDSSTWRPLVDVTTRYNSGPAGLSYGGFEPRQPFDAGEIALVDVTRDVNGDGRDDIVLPDVDGFWIAVQKADGTFSDARRVGPAEPYRDAVAYNESRTYGEVGITPLTIPLYLSRLYSMDFDQDGRPDLVFWNGNEDRFDVHLQEEAGTFAPVPESFTTEVPFESDGDYSLAFRIGDVGFFSLVFGVGEKKHRTVLRAIGDMNGDGVADLVTHSLEGRSLLRQRSRYAVHFGAPTPEGVEFSPTPGTAALPRVKAGGMEAGGYSTVWLRDVDGDGSVDLLRGDVEIGIGAIVRALLGTSLTMRAELFRMDEDTYPPSASARRRVKADLRIGGGRDEGFFPAVLVGDVNGDGRADILVGKNRETLHIYLGVPTPDLLSRKPTAITVALPGDERNSWLADLDADGSDDIVLHQPSSDEPHRVTLLISGEGVEGT